MTEHPTGEWVVQQLREAFPENMEDQYLIFDRDTKFSAEVHQFLDSAGVSAIRTSYRSPWQNGVAERWVRSFRNDLLDHVIVLNEAHLRRIARDYLRLLSLRSDSRWIGQRYAAEGDRHRSGIPVSNWHHILVWEVSTIAIPGQRLLERCEWNCGDVQGGWFVRFPYYCKRLARKWCTPPRLNSGGLGMVQKR